MQLSCQPERVSVRFSENRDLLLPVDFSLDAWNLSKINFSIPNAGKFAVVGFPGGGATGVLYARRSADGIFTGGRSESGLTQFANLFAGRFLVTLDAKREGIQKNPVVASRLLFRSFIVESYRLPTILRDTLVLETSPRWNAEQGYSPVRRARQTKYA